MRQANIDPMPTRKREDGAARTVTKRSFHSLRHYCNSAMADAGIPQETRRQIVGHASNNINDIYTHWQAEKLAEAIDIIPD